MKKVIFTLFFAFVLCGISSAQTFNAIEPELQKILEQKNNELIDIQVYFKSKVNSKQLNQKTKRISDKSAKKEIIVRGSSEGPVRLSYCNPSPSPDLTTMVDTVFIYPRAYFKTTYYTIP